MFIALFWAPLNYAVIMKWTNHKRMRTNTISIASTDGSFDFVAVHLFALQSNRLLCWIIFAHLSDQKNNFSIFRNNKNNFIIVFIIIISHTTTCTNSLANFVIFAGKYSPFPALRLNHIGKKFLYSTPHSPLLLFRGRHYSFVASLFRLFFCLFLFLTDLWWDSYFQVT